MNEEVKERIPTIIKKIGEMTYKVRVHFSEESTEDLQGKMERILREEVKNPPKKDD